MRNNSKVTAAAAKALPKGSAAGKSFTKRPTDKGKTVSSGRAIDPSYIAQMERNAGAKVWDDNAGTKTRAGLPDDTMAMKAPPLDLPAGITDMKAAVLPLPSADTNPETLGMVRSWDAARDAKLGRQGS